MEQEERMKGVKKTKHKKKESKGGDQKNDMHMGTV